jgi:alpha/beta superfamily hydrolase
MNTLFSIPPSGSSQTQVIDGPAGAIELLLSLPRETPRGTCLICHPHPLYGGAMSNKVVYALASTAARAGLVTLRFNFRGVGRSGGQFDQGEGETDDTVWLAGQLRAVFPQLPLVLAGFSFGAFVSLQAAPRVAATALMSVAPPFALTRPIYAVPDGAPPHPGCPWAVIHSRDDDTVAYDDTAAALAGYQPPPVLTTVDGAGHFFHGRLGDVDAAFAALLDSVLPAR